MAELHLVNALHKMSVKKVVLGLGGQLCAWVGAALGLSPAVLH